MKRLVSVAAIAVAVALGGSTAAKADDAAICAFMKQTFAEFNGDGPHKVDAVTQVETSPYDCATKTADFHWSFLVEASTLNEGWQGFMKDQFSGVFCGVPDLTEALKAGWTANATWTTKDGVVYSTGITCP